MKGVRRRRFEASFRKTGVLLAIVTLYYGFTVGSVRAFDEVPGKKSSTYAQFFSSYILHRMPHLLEQLRGAARSNEKLKPILDRVLIKAPVESLHKMYPNAYALSGKDINIILIEAQFALTIVLDSAVGALYATHWTNADTFFDESCSAYQSSYKESLREPLKEPPSYYFDFDTYLSRGTYFSAFARTLLLYVMDDALVWFLLHEVGHHALGHKPEKVPDPKENFLKFLKYFADSRKKEEAADRWASRTMQELGYSLFGIAYYLYGKACVESCLTPLGLITPEEESTHPSYTSRYSNITKEFDVMRFPETQAYSRFYVPFTSDSGIIQHAHISVPNKELTFGDGRVHVTTTKFPAKTTHFSQGVCEWDNNTIHIYFRMPKKGSENVKRSEYIIPDASRAYNVMNVRIYDSNNQLINKDYYPSFQVNSNVEHAKLVDGYTVADSRKDLETGEFLARHLRKVGAPETAIKKVLKAFSERNTAEKQVLLAYGKGQISDANRDDRLTSLYKKYEKDLDLYLGKDRARRFVESVDNDPAVRLPQQLLKGSQQDRGQWGKDKIEENFGILPKN